MTSTIKVTFNGPKPNPYTAFVGAQSPILQKAQFARLPRRRGPDLHRRRTTCRSAPARSW